MKKLLTIFILLCAAIAVPAAEPPSPEELLRTGDAARQSGLNFRIVRKSSELGTVVFYRRSNGDSHSEISAIHRIKNRNGEFQYAAGGEVAIKRLASVETASADDVLPERFELGDATFNGRPTYTVTAFYPNSDEREYRVWYIFKEPVFTIGTTTKMRDGTIYEVIPQQIEFFDELPDKLFEIPAGMRIYQPHSAEEESMLLAELHGAGRSSAIRPAGIWRVRIAITLVGAVLLAAVVLLVSWLFKRKKRGLLYGSLALWILLLGAMLYVLVRFWPELNTLAGLSRHGEALYSLKIRHNYDLSGLLASNAGDESAVIGYLQQKYPAFSGAEIASRAGCSTFAAKCGDGTTVFGRNFDFNSAAPTAVVFTAPEGGYRSLSICSLGVLGFAPWDSPEDWTLRSRLLVLPFVPMDGMNEKGLAAAVLQLPGPPTRQNTGRPPLFTTLAIRLVLDRACSVDEALELLKKYDLSDAAVGHFHFQFADASGASAIVEFDAENTWVVRDCGKNWLAAANLSSRPDNTIPGFGADRLETMTAGLNGGIADCSAAERLLTSVRQPSTVWSAVYDLSARRLNIALPSSGDRAGFRCK